MDRTISQQTRILEALEASIPAVIIDDALDSALDMLQRTGDSALAQAALTAAARCSSPRRVYELMAAAVIDDQRADLPVLFRLLEACVDRRVDEIDELLNGVRLAGSFTPHVGFLVCDALQRAGRGELISQAIRMTELKEISGSELMRLSRMSQQSAKQCETRPEIPAVRVWVPGTVATDSLLPAIELGLTHHGFTADVRAGGFGMLHQDLRDPDGEAGKFDADFLVLAYSVQDLVPELQSGAGDVDWEAVVQNGVDRLAASIRSWRTFASSEVVIHTVHRYGLRHHGFREWQSGGSAVHIQREANQALAGLAESMNGVHLVDLDQLGNAMGAGKFLDERRRWYGRFPASADAMAAWGILVADCLSVCRRGPRKVLVCDLDDTIWGGIVGDVGLEHVGLGQDYPGNAFLGFQRVLLDLQSQGILLALCSKNDAETALSVFRKHPQMLIRMDDVAAYRIGWTPKPEAIVELSKELNLGVDSFVFLDDSPHERAAVRQALPEVLVPELPLDPGDRPLFLRGVRELWPVRLTESDLNRAKQYKAQAKRTELSAESGSVGAFLVSLGQVLTVGLVQDEDWSRLAQMYTRTNQFNVTTRRPTERDLREMHARGWILFVGSLRDCFGDQGIVITALVEPSTERWRIDSLLMSCRVLGRNVEQAFMKFIAERVAADGAAWIDGEFVPSARNGPAAGMYESLGFASRTKSDGDSASQWWELDVAKATIAVYGVTTCQRETATEPSSS